MVGSSCEICEEKQENLAEIREKSIGKNLRKLYIIFSQKLFGRKFEEWKDGHYVI